MSHIITVEITKIEKHPNANKLKVCQVNTGNTITQVVCGASNTYEGMITVLALPKAMLPNGKKITEASLRGVSSWGMLCSPTDLNIREEKGLIDLPEKTTLGLDYQELEPSLLSSTPWHQFNHIDTHWLSLDQASITVTRGDHKNQAPHEKAQCISQTFYDPKEKVYKYRHFL